MYWQVLNFFCVGIKSGLERLINLISGVSKHERKNLMECRSCLGHMMCIFLSVMYSLALPGYITHAFFPLSCIQWLFRSTSRMRFSLCHVSSDSTGLHDIRNPSLSFTPENPLDIHQPVSPPKHYLQPQPGHLYTKQKARQMPGPHPIFINVPPFLPACLIKQDRCFRHKALPSPFLFPCWSCRYAEGRQHSAG
jgi:hypothetical protein